MPSNYMVLDLSCACGCRFQIKTPARNYFLSHEYVCPSCTKKIPVNPLSDSQLKEISKIINKMDSSLKRLSKQ